MRARWLIESKFAPPAQLRREIERTRILDIQFSEPRRLLVINAPAGFGKSTVLAQWAARLASSDTLVAWLNLDEDDREPEPFVTYLAEAFRRSLATVSYEGAASTLVHTDLSARAALSALLGELARQSRPIVLILDDYHRAESEETDEVMRIFLERAPSVVRVAIASRSLPRLRLARMKAENRASVIDDHDLRFSEGETSLFFAADMPRFDQTDWVRFTTRVEGWPVALQFARMWLGDGGNLSTLSAASEVSDLGSYLSEQVFAMLSPPLQKFLLQTSPIETISEDVTAGIGIEKSAQRVKELVHSALPITILSQEPLRFRYHHLFRDFLLSRAREEEIDLTVVHRQAAAWFARTGDLAAAIRHALAGNDPLYAAAIVENAGGWRLVYRGLGHLGTILHSVHKALSETTDLTPRLVLGAAVVAAKRGHLAEARTLFDQVAAENDEPTLNDEIRVINALIRLYCDEPLGEDALHRLVELVGRIDENDPMTAALATNLVAYFMLENGAFRSAHRFGERAIHHFRRADALFGEMHLYVHIGQAKLAAGDLGEAEKSYQTMQDLCRKRLGDGSDLEAIASVLASEAHYIAGDRVAARGYLSTALQRIEEADGWCDVFAAGYITAARLELSDHGPSAAYSAIERGLKTAGRRQMRRLAAILDEEHIRIATLCGDLEKAVAICRKAQLSLDATLAKKAKPPASSLRGDGHALVGARLSLRLGQMDATLAFLDVAEEQAQKTAAPYTRRITMRILRAFAEERLLRLNQARAELSIATGLATASRFPQTILDEGEAFRALTDRVLNDLTSQPTLRNRLSRLIDPARSTDTHLSNPDDFGLSIRERQVLELLAEGLTNKEIGRQIGIGPNAVKYHLKRLFAKLSVGRRVSAVARARRYGLVD